MKLDEMADLIDGLGSFLERFGTKGAMTDLHTVSSCFRAFRDESVNSFCSFVVKAKQGQSVRKPAATANVADVDEHVAKIRGFLDNRRNQDYAHIDTLLQPVAKLKVPAIKAIGERIGCPLTARTKGAMIATLRNWLSDILLSDHQSSFNLNATA
jgi:hypothetical protein